MNKHVNRVKLSLGTIIRSCHAKASRPLAGRKDCENMRSLIRISDYSKEDICSIFRIADDIQNGAYSGFLRRKTVVMFFPNSSIRTRVTFEKGVYLLGGQPILFPPETLNKKEEIEDVKGYLKLWADVIIVRHKDISLLDKMNKYATVPIINAMTDWNHPCEVLSDLYSLSKLRDNYLEDHYLFCGAKGNIGNAWKEAAQVMGFSLSQCCPVGYEIQGIHTDKEIDTAIRGKDTILTDSLTNEMLKDFKAYQITAKLMNTANKGAILNPCPPFNRGEEVSQDVIDSGYFVGYQFKKCLLEVQQAIIIFNMTN